MPITKVPNDAAQLWAKLNARRNSNSLAKTNEDLFMQNIGVNKKSQAKGSGVASL